MTDTQLSSVLQRIWDEDKLRIVFWYDGRREFEEGLAELGLKRGSVREASGTG